MVLERQKVLTMVSFYLIWTHIMKNNTMKKTDFNIDEIVSGKTTPALKILRFKSIKLLFLMLQIVY